MSWLEGWSKRIKLSIDHDKIDAGLTHFPVTVFLSSTHGDCVFDELQSNANRFKIAFTKADGETQLYAEIVLWDDASEKAVINVSRSILTISSSVDTDLYLYYDSTHVNNTTYIGDIDSSPGYNVWNSGYKCVTHMVNYSSTVIKDSTGNGWDWTKHSVDHPSEGISPYGRSQYFDGAHSGLYQSADRSLGSGNLAIEMWIQFATSQPKWQWRLFENVTSQDRVSRYDSDNEKIDFECNAGLQAGTAETIIHDGSTWVNLDIIRVSSKTSFYFDLVNVTTAQGTNSGIWTFGSMAHYIDPTDFADRSWKGRIAEVRMSNVDRNADWRKATYNSVNDSLLAYGGEEVTSAVDNAIFFSHNI